MRPSYIAVAEYARREFGGVRPRILPRADIHVAIRMLAPLVNRGHGGSRIPHRVDHVKRHLNLKVSAGLCRIAAQLPLPLHSYGWLPATTLLCVAGNRSGEVSGELGSQDARCRLAATGLGKSQSNADKWQKHKCQGFQNASHFTGSPWKIFCFLTRRS